MYIFNYNLIRSHFTRLYKGQGNVNSSILLGICCEVTLTSLVQLVLKLLYLSGAASCRGYWRYNVLFGFYKWH